MTQKSFFWDGVKTGDANTWTPNKGYHASDVDYQSPLIDIMFRALWNGTGNRGVLYGWGNDLEVTGIASPVSVNTGGAVVYGLFYENTAALAVAIPTPTSETRIDRIVVRRDWANGRARVTRLDGIEGGVAPTMVQSPNTFYDIPLAQVSIDIAGVITVTDEREYAAYSTAPEAGSIVSADIPAGAVDLAARSTRQCKFFITSGAMRVVNTLLNAQYWPLFTYKEVSDAATLNAVNPLILVVGPVRSWYGMTFKVPHNLAGTTLTPYVWWTFSGATTASFEWRSTWQRWRPNGDVAYGGAQNQVSASGTSGTVGQYFRTAIKPITGLLGDEMIYYLLESYNASGSDVISPFGVEFSYTGYAP